MNHNAVITMPKNYVIFWVPFFEVALGFGEMCFGYRKWKMENSKKVG